MSRHHKQLFFESLPNYSSVAFRFKKQKTCKQETGMNGARIGALIRTEFLD